LLKNNTDIEQNDDFYAEYHSQGKMAIFSDFSDSNIVNKCYGGKGDCVWNITIGVV